MKYCIFCGHEMADEDTFCTQCGERQDGEAAAGKAATKATNKKKLTRKQWIVVAVAAVVLIGGIIGGIAYASAQKKAAEAEDAAQAAAASADPVIEKVQAVSDKIKEKYEIAAYAYSRSKVWKADFEGGVDICTNEKLAALIMKDPADYHLDKDKKGVKYIWIDYAVGAECWYPEDKFKSQLLTDSSDYNEEDPNADYEYGVYDEDEEEEEETTKAKTKQTEPVEEPDPEEPSE